MSGFVTTNFYGDYNDYRSGQQGMKQKALRYVDVKSLSNISISADEQKYVDQTRRRFTGQRRRLDQLQECLASPGWDSQSNATINSQQGESDMLELDKT